MSRNVIICRWKLAPVMRPAARELREQNSITCGVTGELNRSWLTQAELTRKDGVSQPCARADYGHRMMNSFFAGSARSLQRETGLRQRHWVLRAMQSPWKTKFVRVSSVITKLETYQQPCPSRREFFLLQRQILTRNEGLGRGKN